jgi:branched-chain amino acid transport system substrate-binding protein
MKVKYVIHRPSRAVRPPAFLLVVCLVVASVAIACQQEKEALAPGSTPAATAPATPTPAAQVPGVTDTEIILGSHAMLTGVQAFLVDVIPKAEEAYFRYINDTQGGVCGRKIVFNVEDTQGDPARALEVVRKLVDQDHVFAMVGGVGDPAEAAVWDYLNDKGVPDLFITASGHRFGADPQGHPWSVQLLPDCRTEGALYGQYISENLPGKKVAVLYQNTDLGVDGLAGLKAGLDPEKNQIVAEESYQTTDVDVRSQVIRMANTGAEVAVLYTVGGFTAQAFRAADNMGWRPQYFISYVNASSLLFTMLPAEVVKGTISQLGVKLASWTDDPAVAKHWEIMRSYGGPTPNDFTIFGQLVAEMTVEVLNRSCDNLTREGLMDTVLSLKDYSSDMAAPGLTISYSETDRAGVEASENFLVMATVENGQGKWEYLHSQTR